MHIDMLIAGNAILHGDLMRQTTLQEHFQRAVNGGEPDPCIAAPDRAVQVFGRKALRSIEEGKKDGISLSTSLEPDPLQVSLKRR